MEVFGKWNTKEKGQNGLTSSFKRRVIVGVLRLITRNLVITRVNSENISINFNAQCTSYNSYVACLISGYVFRAS